MARKNTSAINEKGIPLMDIFYKQYFGAIKIVRPQDSDYENNTWLASLDINNGIDVQITTNTGELIMIQEKVRRHDKIKYNDFTLGIYLNFYAKELWDGEYIKFLQPKRPKYYFTVYLNEQETLIEKWYLTDINKMMNYVNKNYIITQKNVWRYIQKGNEQFLNPVKFALDNIYDGFDAIQNNLNVMYKQCPEFHRDEVYTTKNIQYNEGVEDGCSGTSFFGISWDEMIVNNLVVDKS